MEKIYNSSELYRFTKANVPRSTKVHISSSKYSGGIKFPKQIPYMDHSYVSTREHSTSITPHRMKAKSRDRKLVLLTTDKYQSSGEYFQRPSNSECEMLPKLPKTMSKRCGEKKKQTNSSFQEGKRNPYDNITRIYSPETTNSYFTKRKQIKDLQKNNEITELQQYFFDFQQKSKLLLSQLEQKVLGKDTST